MRTRGCTTLRQDGMTSETCRFVTRDTVWGNAGAPGTLNLYAYCLNNPLGLVDPTGHAGEGPAKSGPNGEGQYYTGPGNSPNSNNASGWSCSDSYIDNNGSKVNYTEIVTIDRDEMGRMTKVTEETKSEVDNSAVSIEKTKKNITYYNEDGTISFNNIQKEAITIKDTLEGDAFAKALNRSERLWNALYSLGLNECVSIVLSLLGENGEAFANLDKITQISETKALVNGHRVSGKITLRGNVKSKRGTLKSSWSGSYSYGF